METGTDQRDRTEPEISVVITVDYEAESVGSAQRLREVLEALAAQESRAAAEYVLVESVSTCGATPSDALSLLPELRVIHDASDQARELKKRGVQESRTDWVALLDGDCVPEPGWLRACLESRHRCVGAAVVSGRTLYPASGVLGRVMNVISRSYIDADAPGYSRHLTENNMVSLREVYLEHAGDGRVAHSSSLLSQAMLRAGHSLGVDPAVVVTHAYDWSAEREIRSSLGYGMVRSRQIDHSVPYSWTVRLGPVSIVAYLAGRLFNSYRMCLANGSRYGVASYHQPLAFVLATICCCMEVPAALHALRGDPPPPSAFR